MDEFLHKDMAFHRQIAAMTGNAIYVALSQAMFEWLAEFHAGLCGCTVRSSSPSMSTRRFSRGSPPATATVRPRR